MLPEKNGEVNKEGEAPAAAGIGKLFTQTEFYHSWVAIARVESMFANPRKLFERLEDIKI